MAKVAGSVLSLLVLSLLAFHTPTFAQSMPTTGVLTRIAMVESQYGRGSTFSVDVDNREYWITAKHIITGATHPPYGSVRAKSVTLKLLDPYFPGEKWLSVTFSVIDTEKDVDIVVLAAPEPILKHPLPSVITESTGAFLGGDCEFLGFPYGGGWQTTMGTQSYWLPLVKHCTVSAIVSKSAGASLTQSLSNEDKRILILDGINNEGFSGGPVVFRTGPEQKIMGVISGYFTEPTEVVPSSRKSAHKSSNSQEPPARPKEKVNVNSGFIIAFDIQYAIDAAHKSPIGPLRDGS